MKRIASLSLFLFASISLFASVTIQDGLSYSNLKPIRAFRVYYPAGSSNSAKLPVVVFIHGGGWAKGDYDNRFVTPATCPDDTTVACWLADNGYVVFSINYTLTFATADIKDLVVAGPNQVTSSSYSFNAADVGSALLVLDANFPPWNIGGYSIVSVANGAATLNESPGPVGAASGMSTVVEGSTLWPAQWQDCNCFLRYLAENLGVNLPGDPQNIFMMGHSAGAHLAGLVSLSGNNAFPTNCEHSSTNYTIRGAMAASPATDLVTLNSESHGAELPIRMLLGCIPGHGTCDPIAAGASITTYVGPNLPPYISFSGGSDVTIPPENAQEAQTAFASLSPPVVSQWVNLGPSFYHDLDLPYYSPCSKDPSLGSEPSPCGSAGSFFQQALAFMQPLATYTAVVNIASGNNQSVALNQSFPLPMLVSVTGQSGAPLPGARVTFTANNGGTGAGANFSGVNSVTVTADANGQAIAPALTANASSGQFTVSASANGPVTSFTLNNLTTGAGSSQSFSFTFTDVAGYTDIAGAQIVVNATLTAVNSCYLLFARPDQIALADDSGITFTSTSLGAPAILQNSQCSVIASQTTQSGSGTTVNLTLTLAFKAGFAGPKNVWSNYNTVAGFQYGWQQNGAYTAIAPTQPIVAQTVSPQAGSGQAHAFTFNYSDTNGAPDIAGSQILFNTTLSGTHACYILFSGNNQISLAADDGNSYSTAVLGQQAALQNSQCTVYSANSYQSQSGQNLSVTVFVAFTPAFAGVKNIYSTANTIAGVASSFSQLGTWTIPPTAAVLSSVSVTPSVGSGPSQSLTLIYADPNGYQDIASSQIVVNSSLTAVKSCYILFSRAANQISLASDDGTTFTAATLGSPGTLQNSHCQINSAASSQFGSGNYLSLTVLVTPNPAGRVNVYSAVQNLAGTITPYETLGTWNATSPPTLTPVAVSPSSGATPAGTTQEFTFTLSDPKGATDISGALMVLYPSLQGSSSCYILWGRSTNLVSLASDDARSFSSAVLGSTGLLENSQCTIDPSKSFAALSGNTANLTLAVSFQAALKQFPQIYSFVNVETNAAQFSGWFVESRFTVQ